MKNTTKLLLLAAIPALAAAFTAPQYPGRRSVLSPPTTALQAEFMETLKFGGSTPSFDVITKTQEYVKTQGKTPPEMYAADYVLRGPVIGPINRADLASTSGSFGILEAFPDLETNPFGFTVDSKNPYRCMWFERWTGTHTGSLEVGGKIYAGTGKTMETPAFVNSIVWNPDGKIIYEAVGNVVDRFEGNTEGKAAVFGILHTVGVSIPGTPGSAVFRIAQRIGNALGMGKSFSAESDIPSWWKSKSRGADATDM